MAQLTNLVGFFGGARGTELVVLVLVILLLFGGRKIPELMRGLGRGIKEFKDGKDGKDSVDSNNANENKLK